MQALPPDPVLKRVYLSGVPIAYRQAGSGPPLLLVHGWGGSSRYWQACLRDLADLRTIYALDLPGYGESPPLLEAATSERLAALLMEFADTLGLAQFDLNGHSFSASVTAFVAARHRARVHKLILTCASTYRNEHERRLVDQMHRMMTHWMALRHPLMAKVQPLRQLIGRRFFYRLPADDELLQDIFQDFLRMDRRTAKESASSAANPAVNPALQQVAVPTLVIGARKDALMPAQGIPFMANLIPNSQLVWIEKCGHLPMLERPAEYNQLLRTFLTEQ